MEHRVTKINAVYPVQHLPFTPLLKATVAGKETLTGETSDFLISSEMRMALVNKHEDGAKRD
jgi:hypothetical protein